MKNKNYKYIAGFIVGFLLITSVYGVSTRYASDVIYDSINSSFSSGDVQGAIDDLEEKINEFKPTSCVDGYYCEPYKYELALGDYVSYKPVVESFSVDLSMTGHTFGAGQTIYPSELNLWRVLNIYEDGRVDLISEYVSSTVVPFSGQVGYKNFVGYLNDLAEQYETEGITDETEGSRYFGYNGQTEYLSSIGFSADASESEGGGDTLYTKDYNQLYTVLGTRIAYEVGNKKAASYWMASRTFNGSSSSSYSLMGDCVDFNGYFDTETLVYHPITGITPVDGDCVNTRLRPIVTLKSGLRYEGLGADYAPIKIITS